MKFTNVSKLLRACALAGLFVAFTQANAAAATMVNFSVNGVFASSGTNVFTAGAGANMATFSFTGSALAGINAPSNISFGDIQLAIIGTGYSGPEVSSDFTMTVTQTVPTGGSGAFVGELSGTLAQINSSMFALTFTTPSVTIGDVTYTLDRLVYNIVPVVSGQGGGAQGGNTTIQGQVAAVPEPATMMLLGSGLLAAFRARRRKA